MKPLVRLLVLAAMAIPAMSQTNIVSDPLGFNSVTCYPSSDTVLGVPFRQNGSQQGSLASVPSEFPDPANPGQTLATLSLSGTPNFTPDQLANTHYVKFSSGDLDGKVFPITTNLSDQLTIALNGDSASTAIGGDTIVIAQYWTLDSLFPPAAATSDPATTGHAIVASTNFLSSGRMTEVLLPNLNLAGINIAPVDKFYLWNGAWRKAGELPDSLFGGTQLHPDVYLIIRHSSLVGQSTTLKCSGEVELGTMTVPLSTNSIASGNGAQDNFIALPRPIEVSLNDLGLAPGAFAASTNFLSSGRTDELLVFDNSVSYTAFNKAPSIKYFFWDGLWRKQGDPFTDAGLEKIPPGVGFMIRKAPTADGATVFWNNGATYSNLP